MSLQNQEDNDRCSATLCFKSVSLHSGRRDELVLAVDACAPFAGCAASLEIEVEILHKMFLH